MKFNRLGRYPNSGLGFQGQVLWSVPTMFVTGLQYPVLYTGYNPVLYCPPEPQVTMSFFGAGSKETIGYLVPVMIFLNHFIHEKSLGCRVPRKISIECMDSCLLISG